MVRQEAAAVGYLHDLARHHDARALRLVLWLGRRFCRRCGARRSAAMVYPGGAEPGPPDVPDGPHRSGFGPGRRVDSSDALRLGFPGLAELAGTSRCRYLDNEWKGRLNDGRIEVRWRPAGWRRSRGADGGTMDP